MEMRRRAFLVGMMVLAALVGSAWGDPGLTDTESVIGMSRSTVS